MADHALFLGDILRNQGSDRPRHEENPTGGATIENAIVEPPSSSIRSQGSFRFPYDGSSLTPEPGDRLYESCTARVPPASVV